MRTKWESSQAWLSESIVTQPPVKPHAGASCWRPKRRLQSVTKVCNCPLCELWWSWWDFATEYQRVAFDIL